MCLRVFWTIIFMASSGMFIYQMILLIQKYKAYDVTVQTEVPSPPPLLPQLQSNDGL